MDNYQVTGAVARFNYGRIGLTKNQYDPRKRFLKKISKSVYEILSEIQFKRGEVVKLDEFPKHLAGQIEAVDDLKSEAEAAEEARLKAEAEEKARLEAEAAAKLAAQQSGDGNQ